MRPCQCPIMLWMPNACHACSRLRFRVLPLLALEDMVALAHIRVAALASTRCRAFCRGTETKAPGGKEAVMYAEHMSMPVHFQLPRKLTSVFSYSLPPFPLQAMLNLIVAARCGNMMLSSWRDFLNIALTGVGGKSVAVGS